MTSSNKIKRIGVLTSGGDCAGLNAAIRAVIHRAISHYEWEVYGILDGTSGLMERPMRYLKLGYDTFEGDLLRRGGTILGTINKGNPFEFPMPDGSKVDRTKEIVEGYQQLQLDALIAIGGDGSMKIISQLTELGGIQFIGIPKTIDNDVAFTEFSIGFTTAVDTAVEALDRLRPTAASHKRVIILEVMGRDAGHIALTAGIAGGANVILLPEIPYDIEKIAEKIEELQHGGRNHALIVCSEAASPKEGQKAFMQYGEEKRYGGIGHLLCEQIAEITGAEVRATILGHVQRGGIPSGWDRLMATTFGVHAVDLLAEGRSDLMVCWNNKQVGTVPINDVVSHYSSVNLQGSLIHTARGMGICLGD